MRNKTAALSATLIGLFAVSLLTKALSTTTPFGTVPVLAGGRIKPLDTVARTSLLALRGKQTIRHEGRTVSANDWLIEMTFRPAQADVLPVFQIDDPDVLGLMGIEQGKQRTFTFNDLKTHLAVIDTQATQADAVKSEQRDRFQRSILALRQRLVLYQKLQNTLQLSGSQNVSDEYRVYENQLAPVYLAHGRGEAGVRAKPALVALARLVEQYRFLDDAAEFFPIPGARGVAKDEWVSVGRGLLDGLMAPLNPSLQAFAQMGDAWREQNTSAFKTAVNAHIARLKESKIRRSFFDLVLAECAFNRVEPFYICMMMYILVFLLVFASWIVAPTLLRTSAFHLLIFAWTVHTLGLVARMIFQGRPPVTNLYSSAIFVGWFSVLLGIVLERSFKNGLGSLASAAIGFVTLIIAHHLAVQGDTLEMMRAVLDSNFWLATHVVTITIGYSATFLAGFLAATSLIRRIADPRFTADQALTLDKMVYGVVCFSLFFSFVGTILGGIWADQSWGRFWGWDPKENGALMIVLWNAFVLHVRVGGMARGTTLLVLAVFGNVITAFSWFGVNMLGIGLHSYGFMDQAFVWLSLFSLSQLAIMALAWWRVPVVGQKTLE